MDAYADPAAVTRYAEGPPRLVPGFADLQRMCTQLLAESAPAQARVLVLGAGGGLELRAFATAHPGWRFDGVDPSAPMLALAAQTLGDLAGRATLHHGYIDSAPQGPFDAAACLLTLHFVAAPARMATLQALHQRLRPGAPLVLAHMSFDQAAEARERWLARYAAFAVSSGIAPTQAANGRAAVADHLHVLSPAQDEAMLRDAGFARVEPFYQGLGFRGWLAHA
ncbi:class I SAM-dependent methyltransferase [Stenotrophomonas sp. LGBM10]|uniref:class I SAM-dependent methyltransferase n=1 Tax=Stenotrophomonas sp. LGBM10 TaxID=3390038 RepID=UPI00398A6666